MDEKADANRIFAAINAATAGERMGATLIALKDHAAASCCLAGDSVDEAIAVARRFQSDMEATIRKNFAHYRSQLAERADRPAGHA